MEDNKNINDSTIINKNINNIPLKSISVKDEILLLRNSESNVTKKVDKLEKNIKVNSLGNENGNEPKYENKNNEDIIKLISSKKEEPEFLQKFRKEKFLFQFLFQNHIYKVDL